MSVGIQPNFFQLYVVSTIFTDNSLVLNYLSCIKSLPCGEVIRWVRCLSFPHFVHKSMNEAGLRPVSTPNISMAEPLPPIGVVESRDQGSQ